MAYGRKGRIKHESHRRKFTFEGGYVLSIIRRIAALLTAKPKGVDMAYGRKGSHVVSKAFL